MNRRRVETSLAWFTIGLLVIYVPAETWVSWPYGLWNPFYIVDLIAMVLMGWGAAHSLRARPRCAPGVLCGAFGWASANGWRATFGRLEELRAGGQLDYGSAEAWCVGIATSIAMLCFAILLALSAMRLRTPLSPPGTMD